MLVRRLRWPWRLILLYLVLVAGALLLLRPPVGAPRPSPEAVPALAPAAGGQAGPGWAGYVLRLGLPLLDIYPLPPLWEWPGAARFLGEIFPLRLLHAQVPVLALAEPGEQALPERGGPLPLPYVAPDAAGVLAPPAPVPPPAHPLVIVYHTHAHEAYTPTLQAAGLPAATPYADDERANMVRVGEELARALQEQGIPTLHLRTLFDADGLTGAYQRSEEGVRAAMARYPSARVLLDIHRDASGREATVTVVGGRPVARVLVVVGRGNPHLPNPHWESNRRFGAAIARALDTLVQPDPLPPGYAGSPGQRFPPLVRQLADGDDDPWTYVRDGRFNQHLSPRATLIEIGGPDNTLVEAVRTARLVARAVATVLRGEGVTSGGEAE